MNESELLMKGDCPYNYQCKAVDCMECVEIHHGEKKDGQSMSSVQGDISIGARAFELVNATGSVTKEMHRIGLHRNKAYDWANGKVPGGRALQAMALAGYDVIYILTGRRSGNAAD